MPESFLQVEQPSPSPSLEEIQNEKASPTGTKARRRQRTVIVGDSHAKHWGNAKHYPAAFPKTCTANHGKSGEQATNLAKKIRQNPAQYSINHETDWVIINIGTNDALKSPTEVVANNIRNIATAAREAATHAEITIMHIPPLRQNATDRTLHEIHRLQINKEIDTWAATQERINTVQLPKSVDGGATKNYMFPNDAVHFTNEANGPIIQHLATVSKTLFLSP